MLCNLYGTLGRWEESGTVRKASGVIKETGGSFIEVNSLVHDFMTSERGLSTKGYGLRNPGLYSNGLSHKDTE